MTWETPAVALIPLGLTVFIYCTATTEHLVQVRHLFFQAVYCRTLLLFPLVSLFAFIGGLSREAAVWAQVAIATIEGYTLILFFGLFTVWGWSLGNVYEALLKSRYTKTRFYFCKRGCGTEFENGTSALASIQRQVYQFFFCEAFTGYS
mmetsp:Transcript_3980/g.4596  ORF Transcript_3980/g.4596 Transcript_3980/m.4596 type:complete len:149 (-) Transcript_3980:624-1070(-)